MKKLPDEVIQFFQKQGFVIVSTLDKGRTLHNSCKGIVRIEESGKIYLLDLYRGRTYDNLRHNSNISITSVDEHRFIGYCLKGKVKIISAKKLSSSVLKKWEDKITGRITQRVIRNIHEEKGHPRHPEILLPKPEYMFVMDVKEIVDLTPHHIKGISQNE